MSAQANMAGMFPPTKAMRWFFVAIPTADKRYHLTWTGSGGWTASPGNRCPFTLCRWTRIGEERVISYCDNDDEDCVLSFNKKSSTVFWERRLIARGPNNSSMRLALLSIFQENLNGYFNSLVWFNLHQAKCYFQCKLILWQYLQRAGSRGKGDEKNPWISLGAAWLHLQTLGKADDKCHGGDIFTQNSSANVKINHQHLFNFFQSAWLPLRHPSGWDYL